MPELLHDFLFLGFHPSDSFHLLTWSYFSNPPNLKRTLNYMPQLFVRFLHATNCNAI